MKKIVSLTIDLSDRDWARVVLFIDGKEFEYTRATDTRKAQAILPLITDSLGEHDLVMQDITGLFVPVKEGSFTGLRVGAAIANTLGTVLQIPINDNAPGVLIEPQYE